MSQRGSFVFGGRRCMIAAMATVGWYKALDLAQAAANLRTEFPRDWHQDPWGWPELGFMLT